MNGQHGAQLKSEAMGTCSKQGVERNEREEKRRTARNGNV